MGKNQIGAANVTMHAVGQAIWGHIWKRTVEKSQTNATNVTMHPLGHTIWGDIWKYTLEKAKHASSRVDKFFVTFENALEERLYDQWKTWKYIRYACVFYY